jgi:hypothetical protein
MINHNQYFLYGRHFSSFEILSTIPIKTRKREEKKLRNILNVI